MQKTPWIELNPRNVTPGGGLPRRRPEFPPGERRTWPAAGLGMLGGLLVIDFRQRLDRRPCRRAPAARRRPVAAAALLFRPPAARRGPLVDGLAMGAEQGNFRRERKAGRC
jgi:hypothetical protein